MEGGPAVGRGREVWLWGQACLTSGVHATPLSLSLRTAGAIGVVTLHSCPRCCVPGGRESQCDSPALGTIARTGLKAQGPRS